MKFRCTHESCFRDTTCALGHIERQKCEHWNKPEDSQSSETVEQVTSENSDIPWNGYSLGLHDLAILAGRGQPKLIGIVGPSDSGKTSLLAFVYMWLLQHGTIGDWDFAGSWTLGGWESVVQHSRWTGAPPPSFPPHTSSEGRHPGILHVSFRSRKTGAIRDVMFADAPGEWFIKWARSPSDPTAEGARWVVENSDTLLLLIDSDAFADSAKLPEARRSTRDLIEQIAASADCPTAIVWAKDDIHIPAIASTNITNAIQEFLPKAHNIRTTTTAPESIEACFSWAIEAAELWQPTPVLAEPLMSADLFLSFRSEHFDS